MKSVGQNGLCCHFHHIKCWAWHLVCLPPMLILSVKGEASESSSSSCLVALAGKHSAHQHYHTLLTLLNTQWGICRLRLEEIGSTELYHAKEDCVPRDNKPFQSSVVEKDAVCTFPCCQPAWRVEWSILAAFLMLFKEEKHSISRTTGWCYVEMIYCWQDWIVQFSRDRHFLLCWLWTCSAHVLNWPEQDI